MLLILLGLTLADPRMLKSTDQVNLFFCLDRSESVGTKSEQAAMAFMEQAITDMEQDDQAGLIVFGKQPSLETELKSDFTPQTIRSQVDTNFTNLYEALQLALGKLPQAGKSRIVLLSDGNQNLNDMFEIAYLAASLGVEIYPVPLSSWFEENEVFLEQVESPDTMPLDTPFEVRVIIVSAKEGDAELILFKNDSLMANKPVTLRAGKNVFRFKDAIDEQGFFLYKAVLNAPQDQVFRNNEGLAFTRGTKKSTVLYLSSLSEREREFPSWERQGVGKDRSELHESLDPPPNLSQEGDLAAAPREVGTQPLLEVLRIQGIEVIQKPLDEFPRSLHGFLEYSAIILDNVPAQAFSFSDMDNIETYVRDIGGGLLMLGGDKSFGAGNYAGTPVEKALPVQMDIPSTLEYPGFCLILVLDHSSSMEASLGGKNKLEGAKIAAFSSVEMLNPTDKVGVLAFDTSFTWIVPIALASERLGIAQQLSKLDAGGGTDLYPALVEAYDKLKPVQSARKHIIVLSDGLTRESDFPELVQSMRSDQITLSTVALGSSADRQLMRSLARMGGGRTYYTDNVDSVPRIFVGETKIAARDVVVEKPIAPQAVTPNEMLAGIPTGDLPPVRGMVLTHPKSTARVLFNTAEGPLLAAWQYGLGRSAALTSDLSGRWGKEWVEWEHYAQFVSQMVKWTQRKETSQRYTTRIERKGEQAAFRVVVQDAQNRYVNHLNLTLNVLSPSKTGTDVVLEQVAPGTYRGSFSAAEIGEYYLNLLSINKDGEADSRIFGYGIPYTDEFTTRSVNLDALERLAAITRGNVLHFDEQPEHLFTAGSDTREYGLRLWPYLALAFVTLLILDVATRKISTVIPAHA